MSFPTEKYTYMTYYKKITYMRGLLWSAALFKRYTTMTLYTHIFELTHAICRALVPRTRALSYLVMYGVVILFWFACCPSPAGRICTFSWSSFKHTERISIFHPKAMWPLFDDKPKSRLKGNNEWNLYIFCNYYVVNSVKHFYTIKYFTLQQTYF